MVSFLSDSKRSIIERIRFERSHKTEGDWRPFIACNKEWRLFIACNMEYVEIYAIANRL